MNHKLPFILFGIATVASGLLMWDYNSDAQTSVEQAEQTAIPEFNPIKREFKLDDGTPCVMVWAPQRAQSSGIACDWDYNDH